MVILQCICVSDKSAVNRCVQGLFPRWFAEDRLAAHGGAQEIVPDFVENDTYEIWYCLLPEKIDDLVQHLSNMRENFDFIGVNITIQKRKKNYKEKEWELKLPEKIGIFHIRGFSLKL